MKQTNKKSLSIQDAYPAVLAVAVVGILVVVLIYFFMSMQTAVGSWNVVQVVNETGTINTAGHLLANSSDCNFASPSIELMIASDGEVIPASNYTIKGKYVVNATKTTYTDANMTYSYTNGGTACTSALNTTNQFSGIIPLIGLLLVITLIGVVIGVLLYSFMGGRQKA
jgi:hypothetical protein